MEDDRVSLLEQQLAQAKLIAEEADKKYEEVGHVPANKKLIFSRQSFGSEFCIYFDEPRFIHFINFKRYRCLINFENFNKIY